MESCSGWEGVEEGSDEWEGEMGLAISFDGSGRWRGGPRGSKMNWGHGIEDG